VRDHIQASATISPNLKEAARSRAGALGDPLTIAEADAAAVGKKDWDRGAGGAIRVLLEAPASLDLHQARG
jgi:hypothetical protein